jgi:hypothetical protein
MTRVLPRSAPSLAAAYAVWLTLSFAGSGCAAFVAKQEYADYRAVRLAPSDDARLLAMQRYVTSHPRGRWAIEIQNERGAREREVFERGKERRAGLELYLAAYPDGAYAAQAQARLSAIALIEQRKQAELAQAAALEAERKRIEEERSRTWVTRFVGYWTKALLGVTRWHVPIEQVARENAELSRAFGRPPRPRCSFDECVKYYDSAFAVPVPGGTRLERTMRLLLRLRLREGKLERAELLLPQWGFSRWIELEERKLVVDADPTARAEAVEAALSRVVLVLDQVAKDRTAIAGFALGELAPPAIGPSGERLDTTVEDPASPPNRIQGQVGGEDAAAAEPDTAQMLAPIAPEPKADMELAPLHVTPDGRAAPAGSGEMVLEPLAVPSTGAATGEMVLDPLAVPAQGSAAGGTPAASGQASAAPIAVLVSPATTRAFKVGALRVVLFAAGTDAKAPAYDAIVIEPEPQPASKGKGARARAAAPKAPGARAPAAQLKPAPPSAPQPLAAPAKPAPPPTAPTH